MTNTIKIDPIMTKSRKWHGVVYPATPTDYAAIITNPNKESATITVMKVRGTFDMGVGRMFCIGDIAEYDSYNLSYTGKIVKITAKCVTIQEKFSFGKKHRLDLNTFAWRNGKFDAAETAKSNSEMMMTL